MKVDPVAEQPRMLPHFAGLAGVDGLDDLTGSKVLLKGTAFDSAKLLSKDTPSSQHAVGIGCEMDCCASLIGEAGLLKNLGQSVSLFVVEAGTWGMYLRTST